MRDTWNLIDAKLGRIRSRAGAADRARGDRASLAFWAIGLPYWILIGTFAGLVEIVPVIGPFVAGALAVGVGLTVSWQTALAAGLAVVGVRIAEDYLVIPRVLGDAVGLRRSLVVARGGDRDRTPLRGLRRDPRDPARGGGRDA